uniref:Uncharacterized protein n=1 Tax=Glossina pallidipes TaxID=7398 RepID=A0A1B0AE37_GLOPL
MAASEDVAPTDDCGGVIFNETFSSSMSPMVASLSLLPHTCIHPLGSLPLSQIDEIVDDLPFAVTVPAPVTSVAVERKAIVFILAA